MAAERRGGRRANGERERIGMDSEGLSLHGQHDGVARQALRCVAAPEEVAATSYCRPARGRRQEQLGWAKVSVR